MTNNRALPEKVILARPIGIPWSNNIHSLAKCDAGKGYASWAHVLGDCLCLMRDLLAYN